MSDVFGGVLLIVGGLLISLLMGWRAPARFREDLSQSGTPSDLRRVLLFSLRWVSPLVIAVGLVISLWDLLGQWSSGLCPVLPSWLPVSWMVCAFGSAHGG